MNIQREINQMTDREAMGLPDQFVANICVPLRGSINYNTAELISCMTNAKRTIGERLVAGRVLSLLGDTRISTFNPTMLKIEGQEFTVGSTEEQIQSAYQDYKGSGIKLEWLQKEAPAFKMEVSTFYLAKYPVTQGEYLEFLLDTQSTEIPSSWPFGFPEPSKRNHPVYTVSPQQAEAYCLWLSKKTGKAYRLPTEIEWEVAASGPENRQYPWGEKYELGRANTLELGIYDSSPVGMFPSGDSYYGVSDMAGNVEEYTANN